MLHVLLVWLLSALVLFVTARLVPGFHIRSFKSALWAAVILGLLNAVLRPILMFLALPLNFLTLGLFTFVVNAVVLRLAAGLLKGFDIDGWIPALFGAVVIAVLQTVTHVFLGGSGRAW